MADNMEERSTTVDMKSSIPLQTLTCAIAIVIALCAIATATGIMGIANAQQYPPIPCMVIGNITINGNEAPVGTVITAEIDGEDRAEYTLNVAGLFVLVINGTNADTGKTMEFFVNDLRSDSTLPWESGAVYTLDFAIFTEEGGSESSSSSASTSTPEITPTPTPTATPAITMTPTPIIPPPGMPGMPPMPASFYGTVSISGKPAPVGTVVQAYIEGRECGNITVIKEGEYADGLDLYLAVYGTTEDTGKQINFTINGVVANETAIYAPGGIDKLELTASTAGGVSLPSFEFPSAIIAVILVIAVATVFMIVYLIKIKGRR